MKDKNVKKDRFVLPANDMAFRKIYKNILENETLTTVFRPEQRLCGMFRGYCHGDIVNARIISELGLDRARVAPKFLKTPIKKIVVEQIVSKNLGSLSKKDFIGSSPDVYDKQSLIYHLGLIYNLDIASFSNETVVTRISFKYV